MVNERAQAVSVAYRYFVLADNLLPGFKDHLAKHVTLEWFGQIIKGRDNVVDFMTSSENKLVHNFSNVMPTYNINWKKQNRKRRYFSDESTDDEEAEYLIYTNNYFHRRALRKTQLPKPSTTLKNAKHFKRMHKSHDADDLTQKNFYVSTVCDYTDDHVDKYRDDSDATTELNDGCYELNEGDLRNLFEPEITSQTVEKIQDSNRIKLKEEMAPTISAINTEREQEAKPTVAETGTTKYLEAIGKICLSKTDIPEGSTYGYYWPRRVKTWKQKCKVQIAYSILTDDKSSKPAKADDTLGNVLSSRSIVAQHDEERENRKERNETEGDVEEIYKLPHVEELVRANITSIPSGTFFKGYLKPINFFDDRKEFLEQFETHMKQDNPDMHSSLRYKGKKLMFEYPNKASFNVTYQICMIVYTKIKKKAKKKGKEEETIESIKRLFMIEE